MSDAFSAPSGRPDRAAIGDEEFFDDLVSLIREYRIWHIGLGGIALLFCGLMVLGGLSITFLGLSAGSGEAAFMSILGIVYVVMAAIYAIPGILLLRSGIAASQVFSGTDDREPILLSLRMQLWLWRITGVLTFAITVLYMGFFGLMLIGGLAFA